MRILIAGLLGAIAMFVWTAIAHMATPLAFTGFSKMQNEHAVLATLPSGIGKKPGLYFYPWVDPKDPHMEQTATALMKVNPNGFIVYHPAGTNYDMMPLMMQEFAKELAQSLIAAFLLSLTMIAGYLGRVGFVTLIGAFGALGTDASYLIWYGFPCSYTLAQMTIEIVGALAAGLVIAWWIGRRPA
jgi:ABC-type transport system substrate-binding protein